MFQLRRRGLRGTPLPARVSAVDTAGWIAVVALLLWAGSAAAGEIYTTWRGTAIRGADPVAYFLADRYVDGSAKHSYSWRGATWRFTSAENRALFVATPERYAPQYGGHCAYAMARGDRVRSDPAQWTIVDSKLYLNYSARIKADWERDIPGFIVRADRQWNQRRDD